MAWTNSKVFRAYLADMIGNVAALDADADTIKFALFDNTPTPDKDVSEANSGYGAGVWAANEKYQAGQWAQGGVEISAGKTVDSSTSGVVMFDGNDISSGAACTLTDVYGGLCYDNTLAAKDGMSFNYLGGANSVNNGTLTIVFNANGVFRATC